MKRKGVFKNILLTLVAIIVIFIIYFVQPYSPIKSEFNKAVLKTTDIMMLNEDVFTEKDIENLPLPVQKYFRNYGYIGTPKMSYMVATHKNVDFSTGINKPTLKIEYKQVNFVKEPVRYAFIDSSMFGIPFQGFDSYTNGVGSMKGVVAKAITLFNQRGKEMDKACLVTVLSECLIVPNIALQDYIKWEEIDNTHAKATISYYGITASGIFSFAENGEMRSFTTNDRMAVDFNGNSAQAPWSAVCDNYKEVNGLRVPTSLKAIWHYSEGEQVYFDGNSVDIKYIK